MLKTAPHLIALSLFAAFAIHGRADTVVLKSGEKLEGRVLSETDTELRFEVKISAGIVDERSIPKSTVAKVEKASPDEASWQQIKGLQLGANSLPAAQYDRTTGPLNAFINQYPGSTHLLDAKKTLAAFEEEKKRVDAGELKLNGNWLTKEEAQKERYQVSGLIALNYMREQQTRGDLIGALNAFDLLERQYPGSRSYPDAVDVARRILPALKTKAATRLDALPAEMAAQAKATEAALEPSKTDMKNAAERERTNAEALLAAAEKQKVKWPPFLPKSDASLRQIADLASNEISRLGSLDLARFRESLQLADKAKKALADAELVTANELLVKARDLWSDNELAARLRTELTAAQTAEAAAPATPAPTGTDENPAPAATASSSQDAKDDAEPPSSNNYFRIVLLVVVLGLAIGGWKVYQSVKSKASDVLE
jgi:hypothetical protein